MHALASRRALAWLAGTTLAAGVAFACAPILGIDDVGYSASSSTDGGVAGDAGSDAAIVLSCDAIVLDPPTIELGDVRVATDAGPAATATFKLGIRNAGLGTRGVRIATAAPFAVKQAGPLGLAPGESRDVDVSFTPVVVGVASGKIDVTTDDGCSASATITGSGTDSLYAVSPAKIDFGSVLCGQQATRAIEVDTAIGAAGSWTATLASPFSVPASGSLPSGAKTSITVTLATPFDAPSPVLTKAMNLVLPDKTHAINVSASGRGAVLAFAPASPVNGLGAVTVTNNGNDVANVVFTNLGTFGALPSSASIAPGTSAVVVIDNRGTYGSAVVSAAQDPGKPGALCSTGSWQVSYDDPSASGTSAGGFFFRPGGF